MTAAERRRRGDSATTRATSRTSGRRAGRRSSRSAPATTPPTRASGSTWSTCSRTRRVTCTWGTPRRTRSATRWPGTGSCAGRTCCTRSGGTRSGCPRRTRRSGTTRTRLTGRTRTSRRRRRPSAGTRCRSTGRGGWQTCDPEYYRWNQWLFLRFYERGLAYRKGGYVNWCPKDQTVLANEQVINGRCERCGTEVVRRVLTQWYFKITEYADRLLADAAALEGNWPDRVLTMQRNWIGRSTGADVDFVVEGRDEPVTVFTTRPDTLFGATFIVVAADSRAGRRAVRRRAAGRVRGVPGAGPQADRHRAAVDRPGEDRRLPGRARGQPGERRADPDVGGRLRAAGLRHRRDHGGARARPARPGLRPQVRAAGAGRRRHRPAGPGGDRDGDARRRRAGELRPAGRAVQGRRRSPGSSRSWRTRAWARRR